jgi:membrane-bound lytic murein transglycosylase D
LSAETREYVPMVLAAAWLFLHPAEYNLRFPKVDGAAGHIDLANAASLNELSVCLGNDANAHYGWYRTLRNLNPQLRPSDVQAKGTRINVPKFLEGAYQRSCVSGKWVALADELQDAQLPERLAAADPPRISHYTVRRGDTLSAIARRFHCDGVRELVRSNHLRSASRLQIGKRLKLDGCQRR